MKFKLTGIMWRHLTQKQISLLLHSHSQSETHTHTHQHMLIINNERLLNIAYILAPKGCFDCNLAFICLASRKFIIIFCVFLFCLCLCVCLQALIYVYYTFGLFFLFKNIMRNFS